MLEIDAPRILWRKVHFDAERTANLPECLFVGFTETVLDAIVDTVIPGSAPLPRTWPQENVEE